MMVLGGRNAALHGPHRRKLPNDISSSASVISTPMRALELTFAEFDARQRETYRRGMLPSRPTLLQHGPLRILITSSPSPHTLKEYAHTLRQYNVKHVVRVCEPTYDAEHLRMFGFRVHEWPFGDGEAPSERIIANWLSLMDHVFQLDKQAPVMETESWGSSVDSSSDSDSSVSPSVSMEKMQANVETVAVHCVAGLGRAPVLAAVALLELGMEWFEAVGWIRALRRGAINAAQVAFLERYAKRPRPLQPVPVKQPKVKSRSGSLVGGLWPSLKAARPFRSRSPSAGKKRLSSNGRGTDSE
eukprot:GFKZ01003045.1.p1 GENE.GFKZ01003045.1~~GFKZ01003045.1.p1  ORF type:complete len:301 (+),score=34.14 GFKZ01003045.1:393-1295(+)